jgi:hypothetical protein
MRPSSSTCWARAVSRHWRSQLDEPARHALHLRPPQGGGGLVHTHLGNDGAGLLQQAQVGVGRQRPGIALGEAVQHRVHHLAALGRPVLAPQPVEGNEPQDAVGERGVGVADQLVDGRDAQLPGPRRDRRAAGAAGRRASRVPAGSSPFTHSSHGLSG